MNTYEKEEPIMIILLVDWKQTKNFWLEQELKSLGYRVITIGIPNYDKTNRLIRWRKVILWWQYIVLGYKGARVAKQVNGTVIGWNFICGVFAALFSQKGSSKVVGLNMIAREKGHANSLIRKIIYNRVFSKDRLIATANSEILCRCYQRDFRIKPDQIYVLHDAWSPDYIQEEPIQSNQENIYIFSGGEAARDWDAVLSVASACPNLCFHIVARKMTWNPKVSLPGNVKVKFDVSESEFYEEVKLSKIVLLPITGEVTAGLIVMLRSILLGKLVITTSNSTIVPFFPPNLEDLLVRQGDIDSMINLVHHYLSDEEKLLESALVLQRHVIENFSPKRFASEIRDLIDIARR